MKVLYRGKWIWRCWSSRQTSFGVPLKTLLQCSFCLRCCFKVLWCPFNMIVFYKLLTTLIVFIDVDQLKSKKSWRQTSAFKRVCGKHVTTISKLCQIFTVLWFFLCQTGSQQKSFQRRGSCGKSMLCLFIIEKTLFSETVCFFTNCPLYPASVMWLCLYCKFFYISLGLFGWL